MVSLTQRIEVIDESQTNITASSGSTPVYGTGSYLLDLTDLYDELLRMKMPNRIILTGFVEKSIRLEREKGHFAPEKTEVIFLTTNIVPHQGSHFKTINYLMDKNFIDPYL